MFSPSPRQSRLFAALCAATFAIAAPPASAQAGEASDAAALAAHAPVVTRHKGVFNGETIRYTATVEGIAVTSGARPSTARIVSFAYTRDGADPRTRPVMFLFNGGPIVPSPYVHIGGLGPKRVAFPDDVTADPSTFRLVENAYSPLDATDLVFIDPASTGFSRAAQGTDPRDYYSVPEDAAQFAAFIRAWLKAKGREGAPVYLFGESYGTNRAAAIAGRLSDGPDPLPLAGVFLYGQAVNIVEYVQRPANVVSYVASLPTLAAIAWHHGAGEIKGRDRARFIADARAFAKADYLVSLYQGDALPAAERERIAARLQEFTGVPAAWWSANRLRMSKEQYRVALLEDRGLLLGRSDARYVAPITDKGAAADPSDILNIAIRKFFAEYLKRDLKVYWPEEYTPMAPVKGLDDWDWGYGRSPFSDFPYYAGITRMMERNPRAQVIVGNGLFDTQTTIGAAELLVDQAGWDRGRVRLREYDGGHMGYSVAATAKAIGDDIRRMVR